VKTLSSASLQSLRRDVELRVLSDRHISTLWLLIPVIILAYAVFVLYLAIISYITLLRMITAGGQPYPVTPAPLNYLGPLPLIPLILQLFLAYFFYLLIRRRNLHFGRQQRFFSDLVSVLREASLKKGVSIEALLGSVEGVNRQAQLEEKEKSALLWSILLIVPLVDVIVFFYNLYFLTEGFYRHERREDILLSDIERALSGLGLQVFFQRPVQIPSRNFILYFIATILTLGVFTLYWEYALIKDPNEHFLYHTIFEDSILKQLSQLVS
jgi:hypothetical protein